MKIRIEGHDLPGRECGPGGNFPGYSNVHVAVQRRDKPAELLDPQPGDAETTTWTLDCTATIGADGALDVRGPYIQGPPGKRFIYLSWGAVDDAGGFAMFRRAKLWLDGVDAPTARAAVEAGRLVARLALTDAKGNPLCAAVRPPKISWYA